MSTRSSTVATDFSRQQLPALSPESHVNPAGFDRLLAQNQPKIRVVSLRENPLLVPQLLTKLENFVRRSEAQGADGTPRSGADKLAAAATLLQILKERPGDVLVAQGPGGQIVGGAAYSFFDSPENKGPAIAVDIVISFIGRQEGGETVALRVAQTAWDILVKINPNDPFMAAYMMDDPRTGKPRPGMAKYYEKSGATIIDDEAAAWRKRPSL